MTKDEFFKQMSRIVNLYISSDFPLERISSLFERYGKYDMKIFDNAVDYIIIFRPPSSQLFFIIDEKLKDLQESTSFNFSEEVYLDNPQASELALKYAPGIIESLKCFAELPYDPTLRIDPQSLTENEWALIGTVHEEHIQTLKDDRRKKALF